jgi:hypothetical protein
MSHQPFETWLYQQTDLTLEQETMLQNHLVDCQACRELQKTYKNMEEKIMASPMVAPQPGFTQRWRAGLAERHARQEAAQVKKVLIAILSATGVTLLLLGIVLFQTATPVNLLVTVFEGATRFIIRANQFQRIIIPWLETVPLILPVVAWIAFSSIFSLLTLFWVYSLWKIFTKGVITNENPI